MQIRAVYATNEEFRCIPHGIDIIITNGKGEDVYVVSWREADILALQQGVYPTPLKQMAEIANVAEWDGMGKELEKTLPAAIQMFAAAIAEKKHTYVECEVPKRTSRVFA